MNKPHKTEKEYTNVQAFFWCVILFVAPMIFAVDWSRLIDLIAG